MKDQRFGHLVTSSGQFTNQTKFCLFLLIENSETGNTLTVNFVLVVSTLEEEIPAIMAKINAEHDSIQRKEIDGFEFVSGTFAGKYKI